MHTGARVRKQKYISIYISHYMKTFLKTGVYLTIIPRGRVGYEMIDSQRGA